MVHRFHSLSSVRAWIGAASVVLFLAACGGGGGSAGVTGGSGGSGTGGSVAPGVPTLQGTWQLTITPLNGVTTAAVTVGATEVSTTGQLDAPAVARLLAQTRFQAYTTTVTGSSIRVVDPDTDYLMVVDSVTSSGFEGCGTCGVGTEITFTLSVNFTESGVFEGLTIPSRTTSTEVEVRYVRRS